MKKISFILAAAVLLACNSKHLNGQELTNARKSVIEKQIDSLFQVSIKAAEKLDYDKLSLGVDDRYSAGFIANNIFYPRYDSLVNFAKTRAQGVLGQSINVQGKKITVISENLALIAAYGDTKVALSDGREFELKFYWTFIYNKINKSWKVIQSHQSSQR